MDLRRLIRSPRRRANRGDAERLLGLAVDHQLGLRRLLNGEVHPRPAWREDVRTRRRLLILIFLADQA